MSGYSDTPPDPKAITKLITVSLIGLVFFALLTIGGCAAKKSYDRYQKRADATNNVKVTKIKIKVAQQQAQVVRAQNGAVQQRAVQRVLEAHGIRRAQDLIAKTLTPLYVQHEAIKAQTENGQGDKIYIPVGPQGVPLVNNVGK